jgi:cytochrome P450
LTPTEDLLSGFIQIEDKGDQLTEDELLANCVLLFLAGHEIAVNLLGNRVVALLRHPDQLDLLRRHPRAVAEAIE